MSKTETEKDTVAQDQESGLTAPVPTAASAPVANGVGLVMVPMLSRRRFPGHHYIRKACSWWPCPPTKRRGNHMKGQDEAKKGCPKRRNSKINREEALKRTMDKIFGALEQTIMTSKDEKVRGMLRYFRQP